MPQSILPHRATPAAVQPHAGDAFPLPANFTLKPRGSGQPLPKPLQKKMEAFFNTSFADVRVHVGHEAPSIGALAFTHGTDLYFAPGQYNPQSTQGQQLLGHELTHVLQQRAGRVRNPLGAAIAVVQNPALEAEAERMGLRAASTSPPVQGTPPNSRLRAMLACHGASPRSFRPRGRWGDPNNAFFRAPAIQTAEMNNEKDLHACKGTARSLPKVLRTGNRQKFRGATTCVSHASIVACVPAPGSKAG